MYIRVHTFKISSYGDGEPLNLKLDSVNQFSFFSSLVIHSCECKFLLNAFIYLIQRVKEGWMEKERIIARWLFFTKFIHLLLFQMLFFCAVFFCWSRMWEFQFRCWFFLLLDAEREERIIFFIECNSVFVKEIFYI